MPTCVGFLRAINLGRNRKLAMVDLRTWLEESGLKDVETYIHTGNVRFSTQLRSRARIERYVEDALAHNCGFEVSVISFRPKELRQVYDDAVGLTTTSDPIDVRRYVTLLKDDPQPEAAALVDSLDTAGERLKVVGRAVHWALQGPTQQARLSNARLEKVLGVGTTRDLKVITTLAQRWGS